MHFPISHYRCTWYANVSAKSSSLSNSLLTADAGDGERSGRSSKLRNEEKQQGLAGENIKS